MAAPQSLSIIIPVRNGVRFLADCLDALLAEQRGNPQLVEIIAVDNASEDRSGDWIAGRYSQVQLIRNRDNHGYAGGCNDGIAVTQGDVVVLLNQDTRVRSGWVQALLAAFADPQVGVAGCKCLYPDGKTIQHAGGWLEWPHGLGRHYGHHELDQGQWDESRRVEWVTGAAFAIRRQLLETVGGLDEGFWPGYYEDVDYCLRAQAHGYLTWYCAEAVMLHQETSSMIEPATIQRFFHRGRLRMTLKHLPPQRWLEEFAPVEMTYYFEQSLQDQVIWQSAYLETIPAVPGLLSQHWGAQKETIQQVVMMLAQLAQVQWAPSLVSEFEFRSAIPVVGGLLAAFRRAWYGIAARWAVRHLQQQQEHYLRRHDQQLTLMQKQIDQLVLKNAALTQQLACLQEGKQAGHASQVARDE
jgi:GT2 family glycosyltransferase